jgi:carbamoyl-phosphate synthase large subunit
MEQVVFNLVVGKVLNEIRIDGNNCCYEPILKEVSVDINDITISSKNIESAIIKTSCINMKLDEYFRLERLIEFEKQDLEVELKNNNSEIFLVIAEAIRKEMSVERICEITKIDKYFIGSVYKIIKIEKELSLNYMSYKLLSKAMNIGLSLNSISYLSGKEIKDLERIISKNSI